MNPSTIFDDTASSSSAAGRGSFQGRGQRLGGPRGNGRTPRRSRSRKDGETNPRSAATTDSSIANPPSQPRTNSEANSQPHSSSIAVASSSNRGGRGRGSNRGGTRGRGRGRGHVGHIQNLHSSSARYPQMNRFGSRARFQASDDEQIHDRIHREITTHKYDCCICTEKVTPKSHIWACHVCWTVIHLKCIKAWAQKKLQDGVQTWSCPGCNHANLGLPDTYTCWCGKVTNPDYDRLAGPHSCGQSCGKQLSTPKKCPHFCEAPCHSGPCRPCDKMGPETRCHCGKNIRQKKCVDTEYEAGWTCGQPCGDIMPCGDHACAKPCHEGLCGLCDELTTALCYCGKQSKDIICYQRGEPKQPKSARFDGKGELREWQGTFECDLPCTKVYECGIHRCKRTTCHSVDIEANTCPADPTLVNACRCGKTPLTKLLTEPRTLCTDPIPHCKKVCNKNMECGHPCAQVCHDGECGPCDLQVDFTCRCGKTKFKGLCTQGVDMPSACCFSVCRHQMSCRKHQCGQKCCPGATNATLRESTKAKSKRVIRDIHSNWGQPTRPADLEIEPEHICVRVCGKMLDCKVHNCEAMCHNGPCSSCLISIFEEVSCSCGKTQLEVPHKCGTVLPPCDGPCRRPKECGHPEIPHTCHPDTVLCPPCAYQVKRRCRCGKTTLSTVPCSSKQPGTCGKICGKKLSCGSHTCDLVCHEGLCPPVCKNPCGKLRSCGHPCSMTCHAPYKCKEEKPCTAPIERSCKCGVNKKLDVCGSTIRNPAGSRAGGCAVLECSDACRRQELARAFNKDYTHESPYTAELVNQYWDKQDFAKRTEEQLRTFIDSDETVLRFKPMFQRYREFIHQYCECVGLLSEAKDPEGVRFVEVRKGGGKINMPYYTILDYANEHYDIPDRGKLVLVPKKAREEKKQEAEQQKLEEERKAHEKEYARSDEEVEAGITYDGIILTDWTPSRTFQDMDLEKVVKRRLELKGLDDYFHIAFSIVKQRHACLRAYIKDKAHPGFYNAPEAGDAEFQDKLKMFTVVMRKEMGIEYPDKRYKTCRSVERCVLDDRGKLLRTEARQIFKLVEDGVFKGPLSLDERLKALELTRTPYSHYRAALMLQGE